MKNVAVHIRREIVIPLAFLERSRLHAHSSIRKCYASEAALAKSTVRVLRGIPRERVRENRQKGATLHRLHKRWSLANGRDLHRQVFCRFSEWISAARLVAGQVRTVSVHTIKTTRRKCRCATPRKPRRNQI